MENVKRRLDAWRDAEHRRDSLAVGSPEWQEADEEVRSAEKTFHAELAQATTRYAEDEFSRLNPGWSGQPDRQAVGARD